MRRYLEFALAGSLFAAPAFAAEIQVSDAWMRALPAHLPAAGYFTVHNAGKAPVTLTAASSSACGMLMMHESTQSGGMGSMQDVASLAIPAGGDVKFAPGGYHLMCMDPKDAVKPGGSVDITLSFADGSKTTAQFAVRDAQGK